MAVKPAMAKAVVAQPAQMSGSSKARVRLPSRARDFPEFFRRRRKIPIPSFSVPKKTAFAPEKNNGLNIFNADQSGTFWPEFCAEPASVLSPMQLLLIFRSILGVGNYLFWQIFHLFPKELVNTPHEFLAPNQFESIRPCGDGCSCRPMVWVRSLFHWIEKKLNILHPFILFSLITFPSLVVKPSSWQIPNTNGNKTYIVYYL